MASSGRMRSPVPVALIDEQACIGCTICIQKCPVDAIVGAPKRMHTVLAAECIGCRLCVAPCPVDCITMIAPAPSARRADPAHVRERYRFREFRLERARHEQAVRLFAQAREKLAALGPPAPDDRANADPQTTRKRAVIERALARARARQQAGR